MKNEIKISIVMIDGGFRENTSGVEYFCHQNFPDDEYEIIWVDYFDRIHSNVSANNKVISIPLNKTGIYHSSYCFNRGIKKAQGEIIIIPDADQIVLPDFLDRVWDLHNKYEKLVVYGYRYDEVEQGLLKSHDVEELQAKCVLKNPLNYGGCLTVRKKWLLEMNGYEQHDVFRTGFHANGMLMYTRFKNMGLAIQWEPSLKLYHPWHPFTLSSSLEYHSQHKIINWVQKNMFWKAVKGIDPSKNQNPPAELQKILDDELTKLNNAITSQWKINSIADLPGNMTQPVLSSNDHVNGARKAGLISKIKKSLSSLTR